MRPTTALAATLLSALTGCNGHRAPRPAAGATTVMSVEQNGVTRTLRLHVPPGSPAGSNGQWPLVLNLHPSSGTAADQEAGTAMDGSADADGFLVAYPQGALPLGSGFAWNVPGQPLADGSAVPAGAADDVAFMQLAIDAIARLLPVDGQRIFVVGFSGGARMASSIGCALVPPPAAIGAVGGLRFPAPCAADRPVAVLSLHGLADTSNPYDGNGPAYWTYGIPAAAQAWAAHDRCAAAPTVETTAPGVERTRYDGCRGGARVDSYAIAGGGHRWPHGGAIEANEVLWQFFAAR
jgi:polyhydroxybutyrate depolymerase